MRLIAISVLSAIVVMPALGAARLPVVNVAAGGVSARAAFGDTPENTSARSVQNLYGNFADSSPAVTVAAAPRRVVSRGAKINAPVASVARSHTNVDAGEYIAKTDVLTPNRPSADLWVDATDAPLRMPSPQEFAVLRSDSVLPEENLDLSTRTNTHIAKHTESVVPAAQPLSQIDNQIARLTELQRRADISINSAPVSDGPRVASQRTVVGHVPEQRSPIKAQPVKLSRLVVPADDGVVTRSVAIKKNESPHIASVRDDMTHLSPTELRQAFRKTFLAENKHLSTYKIDDRFDVASDMSSMEGFTARHDLSEDSKIRPLEIKIKFRNEDSALSRDNYSLLTEYAAVVLNNPTRAIQIGIPQNVAQKSDTRKLAARRLAIVEQVLRDSGISEQRILPVLSTRNDDSFVLRIISSDQYETMTQQKKNIFGDTVNKKSYKSMSW